MSITLEKVGLLTWCISSNIIVPNSFETLGILRYKLCVFPITIGGDILNFPLPIIPGVKPNTFSTSLVHWFRSGTVCTTTRVFCPSFPAIANPVKVFPQLTQALIIQLSSTSL